MWSGRLAGRGALAGLWGLLLLLLNLGCAARASEITFELPDNAKQCFYEEIMQGVKCTLEFQVRARLLPRSAGAGSCPPDRKSPASLTRSLRGGLPAV